SLQHKYLPFRVKIFNESEQQSIQLPDIDELPDDFYLHDPFLDFDSPFQVENILDCTIKYQPFSLFHSSQPRDPYEDELKQNSSKFIEKPIPVHVEISGAKCYLVNVVLHQLRHKQNITHLVLRHTAIQHIGRHYFDDAKLHSLRRIDLVANLNLTYIDQRAFDGLALLEILRIFRCATLELFHRQSLVG